MRSDQKNKAGFKDVDLSNAKIGSSVHMEGATVDGTFDASDAKIGGELLMFSDDKDTASFNDVRLRSGVARQLEATLTSTAAELLAN